MTTGTKAPRVRTDALEDGVLVTAEEDLGAYREMLLIRRFEEKAGQLCALGEIEGPCPLSIGHEASIVGLLTALRPADRVIAGERCHGQLLVLGMEPQRLMAELLSRENGICAGTGASRPGLSGGHRFVGAIREPGLAAALGGGLALAGKERGAGAVCLCFLGDAETVGQGVHDACAVAGQWSLPIVFAIDRYLPAAGAAPSASAERSSRFAVASEAVDGMDWRKARAAGLRAIERAREPPSRWP